MRQNIVPNPSQKLFEAYMDFSGGLNSEIANDKLKDTEFPIFENVDLSGRASAKRRYGRDLIAMIAGNAQGMQWFYRSLQPSPDLLVAVNGMLYVLQYENATTWDQISSYTWEDFSSNDWQNLVNAIFVNIPITDTDGTTLTFQTTQPIEMVQYRTSLFVATGTKLVEVTFGPTGWKASTVQPYKPSSLEVTNQGLNALADNPASWITDIGSATIKIDSVTCSPPNPVINQPASFTAHVEKPSNVLLNYVWSWRHTGTGSYQQLGTFQSNNASLTFPDTGAIDIQVQTTKVNKDIATWDASNENWVNVTQGNQWDSADGNGCAVFTGTAVCAEDSTLHVWKDFTTPIDLSGGDTLDWYWTTYGQSTQNGYDSGAIFFKFYTQGNLTTPVLTVNNPVMTGSLGRAVGGGWQRTTATYDNTIVGLNNIVRVGIGGSVANSGGTYIAGSGTYVINSNDTTTRVDNVLTYLANSATSYVQSSIQILGVADPTTDPTMYASIQTCRMARLDEATGSLILGKDATYPGQIYVSATNNPRYFPINGRVDFSDGTNDPITSFLRFQNYYMVFTKTSISAIENLGTSSFSVKRVHSEIGCVADRSAKVVNNDVFFLSAEGIFKVTPHPYRIDLMNVTRIDWQMKSEITPDTDACAITYDNQYWIAFPSKKLIYRCYYGNGGVWVKDTSTKLNITQFLQYGNLMYQLSSDGNLYLTNKKRYDDAGDVYTMSLESKYFDLDASFNFKKLKRAYFLAHTYVDHDINYNVTVTADGQVVLTPTTTTFPIVNGVVQQVDTTAPNVQFYGGTSFGSWLMSYSPFGAVNVNAKVLHIHGKARRVKVAFTHSDPVACELYGFGLEYKLKKPY